MMTSEAENALTLGAVDELHKQEVVPYHSAARLSVVLEWNVAEGNEKARRNGGMRSHIVRGAPYVTMEYVDTLPRLMGRRSMTTPAVVDDVDGFQKTSLSCGTGKGNFSDPVTVHKEIQMTFDVSDFTWVLYVSSPIQFQCSTSERPAPDPDLPPLPPGVLPDTPPAEAEFELRAVGADLTGAVVRLALINNCTTGENRLHCLQNEPSDKAAYSDLLRRHSEVFPTGKADDLYSLDIS
eukprot:g1855.t1